MYKVDNNNFKEFMKLVGRKTRYTSVDKYMERVITMKGQLPDTKYSDDEVGVYFDNAAFELFMSEEVCSWPKEDRKDLYNNWYVVWEDQYNIFRKGEWFCPKYNNFDCTKPGTAIIKSLEYGEDLCIEMCDDCSKGVIELVYYRNKKRHK